MIDKTRLVILIAIGAAIMMMGFVVILSKPADAATWSGCYAGGAAGYGMSNTDATLDVGTFASVEADGLGAQGGNITGMVGCDFQVAPKLIVGGVADMTWFDTDDGFDLTASLPPIFSGSVATFAMDDAWSIAARVGYLVTPDVLAYGLVGYTEASFTDLSGFSGTPIAYALKIDDMDGVVWGGGVEVALGGGLFGKIEGRYTDFDATEIDGLPAGLNLELDPDTVVGRVGLVYKLGVGAAAVEPMK